MMKLCAPVRTGGESIAMRKTVTIGAIQARATQDAAANLSRTAQMVRLAARRGAQIICLQELYRWA
jgi:hypothetical protein